MKYLTATFHIASEPSLLQTARDLLADCAGDAGFESFEDTEDGIKGYVQEDQFDKEQLDAQLADFPLPGITVTYELSKVEDKDWNETWENEGFDPIDIYNRIVIYDARQTTPQLPEGVIPIAIQARQAFGTGTHQTTQMIIGLLLDMHLAGKRVLDCGCGTGILGIAASKLGAKEIVAYDIDEWSADNARHNAQINHVKNIEVLQGDANVLNHVSGVFDIVLANINRNILLQDMATAYSFLAAFLRMTVLSSMPRQSLWDSNKWVSTPKTIGAASSLSWNKNVSHGIYVHWTSILVCP